jgi:GNAT superfamily N-acetyltransferase
MSADRFFETLQAYWTPPPPGMHESFLGQWKEFVELENRLRWDESLAEYDQEMYPELVTLLGFSGEGRMPAAAEAARPRAVLHMCVQQLRLMEQVFLALRLDRHHAHTMNRGWMNLFMRWGAHPVMGLLWPSLKARYSKNFVEFADEQLNFTWIDVTPKVYDGRPPSLASLFASRFASRNLRERVVFQSSLDLLLKRLFRELGQEWPMEDTGRDSFYFDPFIASTEIWTVAHPWAPEEIWGIALVAPDPERPAFQRLMVWIRPGYRGVGLGTKLLAAVLSSTPHRAIHRAEYRTLAQRKNRFLVVLPPLRRAWPGYREEMAGWLRFFGRQGFVRVTLEDAKRLLRSDDRTIQFEPDAFCLATSEAIQQFRKAEPRVNRFTIERRGNPSATGFEPPTTT